MFHISVGYISGVSVDPKPARTSTLYLERLLRSYSDQLRIIEVGKKNSILQDFRFNTTAGLFTNVITLIQCYLCWNSALLDIKPVKTLNSWLFLMYHEQFQIFKHQISQEYLRFWRFFHEKPPIALNHYVRLPKPQEYHRLSAAVITLPRCFLIGGPYLMCLVFAGRGGVVVAAVCSAVVWHPFRPPSYLAALSVTS